MTPTTGWTFRTYALSSTTHRWDMTRIISGGAQQTVGRIFNPANAQTFNVDARLDNLQLLTNEVVRASLYYRVGSSTINGSSFNQSGYMGLSLSPHFLTNVSSPGPFSLLHMVGDLNSSTPGTYAPTHGFKGWMRNGITLTGNGDHLYFGQKYVGGVGNSRAVLALGENTLDATRQSFSVVFTAAPGAGGAAASTDGLEVLRVWPESNTEGFVGVGDFNTVAEVPTERLHMLDGRLRIGELPEASGEAEGTYKVMVVDDAALPSGERGVVKWVDPSTFGANGCEWTMDPVAPNHVYTAVGAPDPVCPDDEDAVGIGTSTPVGKLHVFTDQYDNAIQVENSTVNATTKGAQVVVSGGQVESYGVDITTYQGTVNDAGFPGSPLNYGVHVHGVAAGNSAIGYNFGFRADLRGANRGTRGIQIMTDGASHQAVGGDFHCRDNSNQNFAVAAHSYNGVLHSAGVQGTTTANATYSYGVQGTAVGTSDKTYYGVSGVASSTVASATAYGVYGSASGPDDTNGANGHTKWAGYFAGHTYAAGMVWTASDEQLKLNIEDLPSEVAVEKLMQLQPKTYDFNQEQFDFMHLPSERQYGLIAQNVRDVLPELVTNIHQPARLDTAGVEIDPAVDFSAMNYQGLIPVLIAGFQQQQATSSALEGQVAQLQDQLAQMQQQLAACCANPALAPQQQPARPHDALNEDMLPGEDKLRIVPNPFNEPPMLYYTMERGGRMQLLANSSDGRELRVLREAVQEKGSYQFEWDTNTLAPGMYYVTLLLDGQPVVKKAVKVDR